MTLLPKGNPVLPSPTASPSSDPHDPTRQRTMPWEPVAAKRLEMIAAARALCSRFFGDSGRSLSVMFPAYNDARTIGALVDYVAALLPHIVSDYQIVVVNDGSADETCRVLADRAARYSFLTVITHEQNRGYGAALRSGFRAATKDWVFYTDGDGQYDPTELAVLLRYWDGCDMVNGYKRRRGDSWTRVVIGRLYHSAAKLLFHLAIHDVDCDFRLIRRDLLDGLHLTSNTGAICVELVRKVQESGYRIREVPVHHYPRVSGRSQFFCFRRVFSSLLMLLCLWRDLVVRPAVRCAWRAVTVPGLFVRRPSALILAAAFAAAA